MYIAYKERWLIGFIGTRFNILPDGTIWSVDGKRRRDSLDKTVGYYKVQFKIDGKHKRVWSHRLVWQHFFGDIPEGLEINHKNGIRSDNRPSNLECVSRADNTRHAYHVLKTRPLKLTPDKITEICQLSQAGKSISTLARQFSVSDKLIFNIIKGKVWTHIPRSVGL
jgi:hypothetical protein